MENYNAFKVNEQLLRAHVVDDNGFLKEAFTLNKKFQL